MNLLWIFLTALLVVIADSLIKEVSLKGGFIAALLNPWMLAVLLLYFIQIIIAIVVFENKGELALYVILYDVFYALMGVIIGIVFFEEKLSLVQIIGGALAIIGAILLNL
jgi:drug/metabolite transporter (DMT)-like permease